MAGRGLASFLEGAVAGAEMRMAWKDRKRDQELQDEERQWAREDREIAAEDRKRRQRLEELDLSWALEQRQRTRKDWTEEDADRAVFREAYAAADAADKSGAKKKPAAQRPSARGGAGMLPTTGKPRDAYLLPGSSLDRMAQPEKAGKPATSRPRPSRPVSRTPQRPPEAPPGGAVAAPRRSALSMLNPFGAAQAGERPRDAAPRAMTEEPMIGYASRRPPYPQAPTASQPPEADVGNVPHIPAPSPERPIGGEIRRPAPESTPQLPVAPDSVATRISAQMDGQRIVENPQQPQAPAAGRRPPLGFGADTAPQVPGAPAAPGRAYAEMPPGSAAAQTAPVKAPVPSAAPIPQRPDAPPVTTPSIEIATATAKPSRAASAAKADLGISVSSGNSAAERVDSFMDTYKRVAVPKIMRHYLETGRPEQARYYEKWIEDDAAQDGLKAWARGVHAASVGDERGFLRSMIEAYNSDGYFDDGYEVVAEGSGLTRNSKGDVVGAKLTFRDQRTGDVFERSYDDIEDVYRMGVNFLSPEQVFEYGQNQIAAAAEADQGEIEHQRDLEKEVLKASLKGGEGYADRLRKQVDEIRSTSFGLSPEEIVAQAVATLEAMDAATAAATGPARPASRQVPVYRGD